MCGRFSVRRAPAEIARIFRTVGAPPNYPARYNVAPTQDVLTVRINPADRQRYLTPLRWGLIPSWATDKNIGAKTINARADTLTVKPSFSKAFVKRRCLIPADTFYEWRKIDDKTTQPYAIEPTDGGLLVFAGLWEGWKDPAGDGSFLRTCTIVTTSANDTLRPLHERMPVILPEDSWAQWLGESDATERELLALLKPAPNDAVRAYPITTRVNSVKNDDAAILEPLQAA